MKQKDIKRKIEAAYEYKSNDDDMLNRIKSYCDMTEQTFEEYPMGLKKKSPVWFYAPRVIGAAACLAVTFVAGYGLAHLKSADDNSQLQAEKVTVEMQDYAKEPSEVATLYIDEKPFAILEFDVNGTLKKTTGVNQDAQEKLLSLQLEGTNVEAAVDTIVGSVHAEGTTQEQTGSFSLNVDFVQDEAFQKLNQHLSEYIVECMKNNHYDIEKAAESLERVEKVEELEKIEDVDDQLENVVEQIAKNIEIVAIQTINNTASLVVETTVDDALSLTESTVDGALSIADEAVDGALNITGEAVDGALNVTGKAVDGALGLTGDVVDGVFGITHDVTQEAFRIVHDSVENTEKILKDAPKQYYNKRP